MASSTRNTVWHNGAARLRCSSATGFCVSSVLRDYGMDRDKDAASA